MNKERATGGLDIFIGLRISGCGKKPIFLLLFIGFLWLGACSNKPEEPRRILLNLVGTEITFPDSLIFTIHSTPVNVEGAFCDYKLLVYIDSEGCTPCRLKLKQWNKILNELQAYKDIEIQFLFIIESKVDSVVFDIVQQTNFPHPICIDKQQYFSLNNSLPKGSEYHTLLLDEDNKVIAVGNPLMNPRIKALYKEIIEQKRSTIEGVSEGPLFEEGISFGFLQLGDSAIIHYTLPTLEDKDLVIEELVTSCDCIEAEIVHGERGEESAIKIKFKPEKNLTSGFYKQYVDMFFYKEMRPSTLFVYGYIINAGDK